MGSESPIFGSLEFVPHPPGFDDDPTCLSFQGQAGFTLAIRYSLDSELITD